MRYAWMAIFLLLVVITAAIAGSFEAGVWYFTINKPGWTPPAWLFGPVWSVLYVLMALAMWLVWDSRHDSRVGALIWWLIQLFLNAAWSWLFFGLTRSGWALAEMLLLIGIVIFCIKVFSTSSRLAAALMLPYLLWLMFAWALNFSIWRLNGGGLGSVFG
jgi:tryptophan-rich sensory protein